jgi:hypothetical protein
VIHPKDTPRIPYETDQVSVRLIRIILVVVVFVAIIAIAASTWIQVSTRRSLGRPFRTVPGLRAPREIGMIDQTLLERDEYGPTLRAHQIQTLQRYGWADREHGIAQIPIDKAMDLFVKQSEDNEKEQSGPKR